MGMTLVSLEKVLIGIKMPNLSRFQNVNIPTVKKVVP